MDVRWIMKKKVMVVDNDPDRTHTIKQFLENQVIVRSYYRRRSRKSKRNFFYAKKGFFGAIGISKKHGPYAFLGVPVKAEASVKPTRNTEVGVARNLTFNETSVNLCHKKRKIEL